MATKKKKKKKAHVYPDLRPFCIIGHSVTYTVKGTVSQKRGKKKKKWQLLFVTLTQPNGGTRNVKTQSITFVAAQRTYSSPTLIKV